MNKILVSIVMTLALIGVADAGYRSSYSSRPSTSSSPSRSYSSPSRSSSPSVSPSVAPKAAPTYKSPAYTPRPSVTPRVVAPNRGYGVGSTTIVHEHHYFGGGYGYGPGYYGGYGGGFGNSPWFWLWLFSSNHQQQPIVVQGSSTGTYTSPGGATSSYAAEQQGPSGWSMFFNVLIGLVMIAAIVALVVWIVHKIIASRREATVHSTNF